MDKPVLVLIILVAGVALSLVAASMAFGFLIPWQNSGRVFIESVDIIWHQSGSYILVNVRNVGGVALTSCTVRMLNPLVSIDDVAPTTIPPGRMATFAENGVPGLSLPNTYIFEASCLTPQGLTVSDKRSAQPHL
jgi:hypothetical protein